MAIRIGTSERDGTFYSQGHALKAILERRPSWRRSRSLESNSASIENANRLHAGEIEFGFMASNWIGRAKNGEPPFARPIDLAMAAPMNAGPLFFIVRADSPIRSFADLRGRRIALGPRTSGMVQHAHVMLRRAGPELFRLLAGLSRFRRRRRRRWPRARSTPSSSVRSPTRS